MGPIGDWKKRQTQLLTNLNKGKPRSSRMWLFFEKLPQYLWSKKAFKAYYGCSLTRDEQHINTWIKIENLLKLSQNWFKRVLSSDTESSQTKASHTNYISNWLLDFGYTHRRDFNLKLTRLAKVFKVRLFMIGFHEKKGIKRWRLTAHPPEPL